MSDAAFARLHTAVQYHVVNSLQWPELRPLQQQAIAPLLDGHHALLIALTAGGKTEAAVLPILSRMLTENWRGTSVLYICPIKALLNNLEPRLSALAGMVGRTAAVWHGDIAQGDKRSMEREPPDILLTTPESLEGILVGSRRDHQRLLGAVRTVIVDEVHAFAADDRGWHLLALLERLQDLGAPLSQRVGLSATVGDPKALLRWLAGHAGGKSTLIHVLSEPGEVDLEIDYVGSIDNAALLISRLHAGEKRLVFCDSRSKVEALALALRGHDVQVFVSHAALSRELRDQAEQAFSERQNCVIVATSTLELGLDVGDLDRVIQIDAPASVASFLQRLGRTGRRVGSQRNTLFIATTHQGLLEALAITTLFENDYVEPVLPPPLPCHVLLQQLFAMLVQHGRELDEKAFTTCMARVPEFERTLKLTWPKLRPYLLETSYLLQEGMLLGLGPEAERRFSGKGLADLCVSFDSPESLMALHGNKLVGHIDPLSLVTSPGDAGPPVLALGGRSWQVVSVDRKRGRVHVLPTVEKKGRSRWLGGERGESREIAQRIRTTLETDGWQQRTKLSRRAQEALEDLRVHMEDTLTSTPVRESHSRFTWWTWAGLAGNQILAAQITTAGGQPIRVDSWSLTFDLSDERLKKSGGWQGLDILEPAWRSNVEPKFSALLPHALVDRMMLERARTRADIYRDKHRAAG